MGLGVDYGMAITTKTKLNAAADAAALAAAVTAKAYIAANPTDANLNQNAIAAGQQQAINSFNVNAGKVPYTTVSLTTNTVTRNGQTLNSTIAYTATIQNNFGKLFRTPTTTLGNTIQASADLPSYLDFYLMVDVSGSMGLPTTSTEMAKLAAVNTDMWSDYKQGCQFACHFPGYNGWTQAAGKIQLRSDAVNSAVCNLLKRAAAPLVPNQYRVGLYPFINQLVTLAGLTSNIASLSTAAQCGQTWPLAFTNLLDTGSTQLYTNNDPSTGTGSGARISRWRCRRCNRPSRSTATARPPPSRSHSCSWSRMGCRTASTSSRGTASTPIPATHRSSRLQCGVMGRLAAVADRPEHVRGAQERRGDDLGPLHPVQPDLVREQQWRYRLGEQPGQRLQPDLSNAPEILCIAGFLSNSKYTYGHQ